MNKLRQIAERVKPYIPGWSEILKAFIFMALMFIAGFWFGHGFGLGIANTYHPVIINVEDGE